MNPDADYLVEITDEAGESVFTTSFVGITYWTLLELLRTKSIELVSEHGSRLTTRIEPIY